MKKINLTVSAAIISACLCFALSSNGQDIHFSMPYSSFMNLNPAFAGSTGCSNSVGGYRNQWPNISGHFITSFLSYDQYVKVVHGGVGINYTNDLAGEGAFKSISVSGIYSAHIPVFKNKFVLSPAIQGTYVQKRFDWSTTSVFIPNKDVIAYPDISAGVLGYNRVCSAGLVMSHFTQPDEGFLFTSSRLPIKYTAHFETNIGNVDSVRSFSFSPSIVYTSQQDFHSLLISCAVKYDKYLLGIGYRNGDAIIGSVGFRNKVLRISYSYDITVSRLGIVTAGSHELAFSFLFNRKYKPKDFMSFSSVAF